jgi:pyruvate/2-oxoglutarate/acetoin dehydrogenase E1 component
VDPAERVSTGRERVVENLNRALHALFAADERVHLLGEDVLDPYGGAFKATRGLSGAYPDRVLGTPISEGALMGVANGLALRGDTVIVEAMFADFAGLMFDQVLNMTAKSVSMYGARLPMRVLLRLPVGARRGYGPTHSQSPQKHFLGIPHLSVLELSAYRDALPVLRAALASGEPCVLVEDKALYAQRMVPAGRVDDVFTVEHLHGPLGGARLTMTGDPDELDCLLVAPGGVADRAVAAARQLLLRDDLVSQVVVPTLLHPFDVEPLVPAIEAASLVCVVEEGVAGGTWGADLAQAIYQRCWGSLRRPVVLVSSAGAVIPAAPHLERAVVVSEDTVLDAVRKGLDG